MIEQVRQYVHEHGLLQPGDRVAVAVSGGADSVALLRAMVDLRPELGIVLSVAHFHHGIRGAEADADREFVRELTDHLGLELHLGSGDSPGHARTQRVSLETGARDLRHAWFSEQVAEGKADKIATAHTLDDQAETVLMRLTRGAGVRGLAGIFPVQKERHLVRPLLEITRRQVESYLKTLNQGWREDSSNQDLSHTRNRIRHQLLPMLERDFNPGIRKALAELAEVARAESEYWDEQSSTLLAKAGRYGKPSRSGRTASREASRTLSLDLTVLTALPPALERQLLHHVAAELGSRLEFVHVQQLTRLIRQTRAGKRLVLPGGVIAIRTFRELQFTAGSEDEHELAHDYQYALNVPGEARVSELRTVFHARVIEAGSQPHAAHNYASLLNPALLAPKLIVRNWRAGDRFFPAKTRAARKVKELLQPARLGRTVGPEERRVWPVVESAGEIVWLRGFPVPEAYVVSSGPAVLIEESQF